MAIKVNGTTVINDSRQLQNVASVDATTVAALDAAGVGGPSPRSWQQIGSTYSYSGSTSAGQYRASSYTLPNYSSLSTLYWLVEYDWSSSGNYNGGKIQISSSSSHTGPSFSQYTYYGGSGSNERLGVTFAMDPEYLVDRSDPPEISTTGQISEGGGTIQYRSSWSAQKSGGTTFNYTPNSTIHFRVYPMQSPCIISNITVKLFGLYN